MTNNKKCKACSSLLTLKDALNGALNRFPFLSETDIKIILTNFNNIPYNQLALHYQDNAKNIDSFFALCERVNDGYPLQYALNSSEFCGLDLYVDQRVLIPRSETEELVLIIKDIIEQENLDDPIVADICTGSGAIALAIKKQIQKAKVFASELSLQALEVAAINRDKLDLDINLLAGESLSPLIEKGIKVDYLVANPPYINQSDEVERKVKDYEPHLALYSDDKKVYYDIFKNVDKVVRNGKIVILLEINELEKEKMLEIALDTLGPMIDAKIIKDIHQKDRFILVRYENEN